MNWYKILIAFCFPIFLFRCGGDQNSNSNNNLEVGQEIVTSEQKNNQKRKNGVMGMVYAAGLTDEEKSDISVRLSNYQIATDNGSYFLGGAGKFKHLIGKCVHLEGKVIKEIDTSFFSRGVFMPSSISVTDPTLCNPVYEMPAAQLEQKIKKENTFFNKRISQIGVLYRSERPRPDVNYDYGIDFLNPFKDIYHFKEGKKMVRTRMAVIPTSKEIHMAMDSLADLQKPISIFGYPVKGYQNSTVYQVFEIDQGE